MKQSDIIQKIINERSRQFNLPGREFDINNNPNDWAALSSAYCLDNVTRNHRKPEVEEFIDSLIKAAAIIVGALEHVDIMTKKGCFQCSSSDQNNS
jgi:preprotein translocase subunit Sss1